MKLLKKSESKDVVLPSQYPLGGLGNTLHAFMKW
jgi:hypothetical protein